MSSFGLLGAYDDYKKISNSNSTGISSKFKIIMQIVLAMVGLIVLMYFVEYEEFKNLYFPFLKNFVINLGWFFLFLVLRNLFTNYFFNTAKNH